MNSLVSVIIPTYNRAHLLEQTLESIVKQTYKDWECIVVDDGSTDNTNELMRIFCEKDTRFQYFKRPKEILKGVNSCRQYGFEKSKGTYVQWFDSDDIMTKDKLELKVSIIKNERFDAVIGNFNYFRGEYQLKVTKEFNNFNTKSIIVDYVSGICLLNFQSILWRRSSLNMAFLKSELSYAEDVYFIFNQLIQSDFKFECIDKVLFSVRKHERALTTSFKNNNRLLIFDELYVREEIWKKVQHSKKLNYLNNSSLYMYLKSIKYLVRLKDFRLVKVKMLYLKKETPNSYFFLFAQLFFLIVMFKYFGKGMTAYQKSINSLLK